MSNDIHDANHGDLHGLIQQHVRAINAAALDTRQAITNGLAEDDARHILTLVERCFVSSEAIEQAYRDCDGSDIIIRAEALASVANAISSSAQRIADLSARVLSASRDAADMLDGNDESY